MGGSRGPRRGTPKRAPDPAREADADDGAVGVDADSEEGGPALGATPTRHQTSPRAPAIDPDAKTDADSGRRGRAGGPRRQHSLPAPDPARARLTPTPRGTPTGQPGGGSRGPRRQHPLQQQTSPRGRHRSEKGEPGPAPRGSISRATGSLRGGPTPGPAAAPTQVPGVIAWLGPRRADFLAWSPTGAVERLGQRRNGRLGHGARFSRYAPASIRL